MRQALVAALVILSASTGAPAAPPRVIEATPDNGDFGVDPAMTEIRIVFDQPMRQGAYSVVGGGDSFPEITGSLRWLDPSTLIIPVHLRPNHEYWLSVNNERFRNFQNAEGEAATPYPIRFRTAGGEERDKRAPERAALNAAAAERLAELLTTAYSYRDRLGIQWRGLIAEHRDQLEAAGSAHDFAQIAGTLLARAQDKHIWLQIGERRIPSFVRPVAPNVKPDLLPKLIPNYEQVSDVVGLGRWDEGVGYIRIDSWDRSQADALKAAHDALDRLGDIQAMIIDVRLNGGGDERLAQAFAARFIDDPVVYAKNRYVDPNGEDGFGPVLERRLQPSRETRFSGQVTVLCGLAVMSSNEAFVLMMKAAGATIVGARTQGSSGNPRPHDLGNGVTVWLPSWQAMTPEERVFEGQGIKPDVPVEAVGLVDDDPVLRRALEVLRE